MSKSKTLKDLFGPPLTTFKDATPGDLEIMRLTPKYRAIFNSEPINDVQILGLGDEEYLRRMKHVMEMHDESLWYEGLPELPSGALI
jgi:hypothetical protein